MNQDAPITAMDNFWTYALFAQDDFKIHPRLNLNLGLRWDVQTAPTDPFDREATFKAGVQSQVLKGAKRADRSACGRRPRRRTRHRLHAS
jgi:outer membrane receptor protein involved in Fe transport